MSAQYEIAVFENQSLYDGLNLTENPVQHYLRLCTKYIDPKRVSEGSTEFNYGRQFISYSGSSGGEGSMMVMLIGPPFTAQMIEDVRAALKALYK